MKRNEILHPSLEELKNYGPEVGLKTETYQPLPHFDAVNKTIGLFQNNSGHDVIDVKNTLSNDGLELYSEIKTNAPTPVPGIQPNFVIRNSYNKIIPFSWEVSARVIVCDNMMIAVSEVSQTKRRHRSRINLSKVWEEGFNNWEQYMDGLAMSIDKLKRTPISNERASKKILECAERNVIPHSAIIPVYKEYMEPRHSEFTERNLYSLYNCFTEIAKTIAEKRRQTMFIQLAHMFQLTIPRM